MMRWHGGSSIGQKMAGRAHSSLSHAPRCHLALTRDSKVRNLPGSSAEHLSQIIAYRFQCLCIDTLHSVEGIRGEKLDKLAQLTAQTRDSIVDSAADTALRQKRGKCTLEKEVTWFPLVMRMGSPQGARVASRHCAYHNGSQNGPVSRHSCQLLFHNGYNSPWVENTRAIVWACVHCSITCDVTVRRIQSGQPCTQCRIHLFAHNESHKSSPRGAIGGSTCRNGLALSGPLLAR